MSLGRFALPSLRLLVPATLLAFTLVLGLATWVVDARRAASRVEQDAAAWMAEELTRAQATLERFFRLGDEAGAQAAIVDLGADRHLEIVLLLDEHDTVVLASQFAFVGRPASTLTASAWRGGWAGVAPVCAGARRTLAGTVRLAADRSHYTACYPVVLGIDAGDVRPGRVGLLVATSDLGPDKAAAAAIARDDVVRTSAALVTVSGLVWLLFHLRLTRRMQRLLAAVDRVGGGDYETRAAIGGRDEIARLGEAFDRMAGDIAREQEQLRRSEASLAAIIESASDAIITVDDEQRIRLFNVAAERIFGVDAAQVIGRPVDLLFPPGYRALPGDGARSGDTPDVLARTIGSGRPLVGLRISGEEFPLEGSVSQVTAGGQRLFTLILRDVTERQRAEATRDALERQVRQAQKMDAVGTLAGGIAHDFNNILAAILGNADVADLDLEPEHPARVPLAEIRAAGERGRNVVRQILTFGRRQEQQRRPIRLQPVLHEALGMLRASLPATLEMRQFIDGETGPVLADPTQVHQVVVNLCTNAWQAADRPAGRLEVCLRPLTVDIERASRVAGLRPGRFAVLTVSDNGSGMVPETLERIFEPFFSTKGPHGTGLGLSVVDGIVRTHDGAIDVRSTPGEGTTFDVYFPVVDAVVEEDAGPPGPLARGQGEHLLFVDDEEPLVRLAQELLPRLNYRVTATSSSSDALARFRAQPDAFDLVVTDLTMPVMDGMALTRALLAIRPSTRILLCTGYDPIGQEQLRAAGIAEIALKPHTRHSLAAAIRRVLDG